MKKISIFFFIFFNFFKIQIMQMMNKLIFEEWKKNFKKELLENNISELTFDLVMKNVKFLPKVIEYDRYQPEFYEDTKTYISKRTSKKS